MFFVGLMQYNYKKECTQYKDFNIIVRDRTHAVQLHKKNVLTTKDSDTNVLYMTMQYKECTQYKNSNNNVLYRTIAVQL